MQFMTATDGCKIAVEMSGAGDPVLLIPGLGGEAGFWSSVTTELQDRFRVISFDHRGAGRSDRPEGAYHIDRIALDALNVLDALEIGKADVVGHSTGGVIAQCLAIDHPERVHKLVISGSWAKPDLRFRLLFEARLAILRSAGTEAYQALTNVLGWSSDYIEAHEEDLVRAVAAAPAKLQPLSVTAARIRMLSEADRSLDLHRIATPTMIVGATDDMIVPYHHAENLAKAIGGARLEAMTGGHFYPRVHSEQFANYIAGFLRG